MGEREQTPIEVLNDLILSAAREAENLVSNESGSTAAIEDAWRLSNIAAKAAEARYLIAQGDHAYSH